MIEPNIFTHTELYTVKQAGEFLGVLGIKQTSKENGHTCWMAYKEECTHS